ncbi:transcription factor IIIA isoform X2 [Genypterus blacodes]|uniref:transcription factor IIIA isoform X2 n=1 Tax=Genypterus blacodes TaxID=154954 RepID=UPI003F76C6D5
MEGKKEPHKRFICSFPDCSAAYNKQWKLDAHLCKHTGVKPFSCEQSGCGKSFTSAYHLSRHELTHSGLKPFSCPAEGCAEAFSTNSNRARHVSRVHAQEQRLYACKVEGCGLEFRKNKRLKSHMCERHRELPPCRCPVQGCDMSFSCPSKLRRHEKVHRGYPCTEEGCAFTGKTWTEYLRHRKEQHRVTVSCDLCSKEFKDSWFLEQHRRVHSPVRAVLKCPRDGCDRSFTTVFNLQSHVGSFHEELRPFACSHPGCGRTFAMKQSLQRHSVAHDPERRKQGKPRPKRSLASRLSGFTEKKRARGKRKCASGPDRGSAQTTTGPPGSVELVSLLQDTSIMCSPTLETHGLVSALTSPLSV